MGVRGELMSKICNDLNGFSNAFFFPALSVLSVKKGVY